MDWVRNVTALQQYQSSSTPPHKPATKIEIWMKTLESFFGTSWKHRPIAGYDCLGGKRHITLSWCYCWSGCYCCCFIHSACSVGATVCRLQVLLMIATALEKEMMRTRLCHSDRMCHSFHYFDYFAVVLALSLSFFLSLQFFWCCFFLKKNVVLFLLRPNTILSYYLPNTQQQ